MIWSGLPWWVPIAIGAIAGGVFFGCVFFGLLVKVGTKSKRERDLEADLDYFYSDEVPAAQGPLKAKSKPMRRRETP